MGTMARSAKRGNRKLHQEEHIRHEVKVTSWDYMYSLGTPFGRKPRQPDSYEELHFLSFEGELKIPPETGITNISITLSGCKGLLDEERPQPPESIGMVSLKDDVYHLFISIPSERMSELVSIMATGKAKEVEFECPALKRYIRQVRAFSLYGFEEGMH